MLARSCPRCRSWNPSWSVANILIGLHSFMNAEDIASESGRSRPD